MEKLEGCPQTNYSQVIFCLICLNVRIINIIFFIISNCTQLEIIGFNNCHDKLVQNKWDKVTETEKV